ncbi:protein YpmT [Bacillus sp. F19]|nr:protein YpmT [Bacillus sp. F19]
MKDVYMLFSVAGLFISMYFGGIAYFAYVEEKTDEVFMNVSYCAIFLSAAVYSLHLKDEKKRRKNN